jgi:phosphoglucosamine mutase
MADRIAPPRKLFGTDGIRGVANQEPVTAETALRVGRALGHLCRRDGAGRPRVVAGKDTRLSGDMLEAALAAGLCSVGVDVLLAGVLPTPAVAFLTRDLQASAGVVISASHNAFQDNGIKCFAASGFKLPDEVEQDIEQMVLHAGEDLRADAGELGRTMPLGDAADRYAAFVTCAFPRELTLAGLQVVVDCANGATFRVGPQILQALGATVTAIGVSPDGTNINRNCGAVHPQQLQQTVRAQAAHVGLALDGDGDRLMLVDESGEVVDGDEVLAMVGAEMLRHGTLNQATVVATVMSNVGLEVALRERGVRVVRVQVGDRYVVEEMRRHGYNLGGEQSGHVVLLDHSTTGDGLIAALAVLRLMVECGRPLSELKRVMSKFPQALINVPVKRRRDLAAIAPVQRTIERIAGTLGERGRVLVRYSGTETKARVMIEGLDEAQIRLWAEEIAGALAKHAR